MADILRLNLVVYFDVSLWAQRHLVSNTTQHNDTQRNGRLLLCLVSFIPSDNYAEFRNKHIMLSVVKPHCELKIALNLQLQLAEEQRQAWTSDTSTQSIESLRKSYTREFRAHNTRSSTCPFCGAFTKSIVYSNTRSDFAFLIFAWAGYVHFN